MTRKFEINCFGCQQPAEVLEYDPVENIHRPYCRRCDLFTAEVRRGVCKVLATASTKPKACDVKDCTRQRANGWCPNKPGDALT